MLYKNCRELPMHNFNEIQITNDLVYLVKDKEVHEQEDLERHWIDILEESFKLSKDNSQQKFFRDRAELMFLEMKLNILSSLAEVEHLDLNEEQRSIVDKLKKQYRAKDIKQAILETTDKVNIKISQFKRQYNTEKSGNFDSTLASMRINGYHVNRHEITVAEWFALIEQIKAQSVKQKTAQRKR